MSYLSIILIGYLFNYICVLILALRLLFTNNINYVSKKYQFTKLKQTELIEDGVNGILFDPTNKEELLKILNKIVDKDFDLEKMKKANIEKIKKYNSDFAASKIIKLIGKIEN